MSSENIVFAKFNPPPKKKRPPFTHFNGNLGNSRTHTHDLFLDISLFSRYDYIRRLRAWEDRVNKFLTPFTPSRIDQMSC